MEILITVLLGLIAFIHLYIMVFEMFLWEQRGPKVFQSFSKDLFPKTKSLALNQGVYNGFLAAGLIWAICISNDIWSDYVAIFFLICVAIAGVVGTFSAEKKIFLIQSVPAIITLLLILL